ADAGLDAGGGDYVNAPAPRTQGGDIAESTATPRVFGPRGPVPPLKGHTGHPFGARGAAGAGRSPGVISGGGGGPAPHLSGPGLRPARLRDGGAARARRRDDRLEQLRVRRREYLAGIPAMARGLNQSPRASAGARQPSSPARTTTVGTSRVHSASNAQRAASSNAGSRASSAISAPVLSVSCDMRIPPPASVSNTTYLSASGRLGSHAVHIGRRPSRPRPGEPVHANWPQ